MVRNSAQVTTVTLSVEGNLLLPPVVVQAQETADEQSDDESETIEEALAAEGAAMLDQAPAAAPQTPPVAGSRIDRGDSSEEVVLQEVKNLKAIVETAFDTSENSRNDRNDAAGGHEVLRSRDASEIHASAGVNALGFDATLFWNELDALQDDVQPGLTFDTTVVGTTAAVTTALSVGYVMWTLKGGYLMASALSSAPLWRMVDPLPVLHELPSGRSDDDENDESLQSMVENSKKKTAEAAV